MTLPRHDEIIKLPDGRRLAYAEYGDANGRAVFLFHGLPGSRLSWGLLPGDPIPAGLRIIAPDRPGYGRSDSKPHRTLLDWAEDVEQLADGLGIAEFAIVGVSGGGPGALACAWKIPNRVTSVGIVSSPAPTDAPGVFEGMSKTNRFFIKLAWRAPWLSSLNARFLAKIIRRNPARYINSMKLKVHDVDQQIVARPEIQDMLTRDFSEALRVGAQGMVDDITANHGRPWGFPLHEIEAEVHFWICELDRSVPPAMGRYLSKTVPNAETTFVSDAGHLWILLHLHEVLTAMWFGAPRGARSISASG
jgi:pimeloyl-ACP methyl ester carboxylesterase